MTSFLKGRRFRIALVLLLSLLSTRRLPAQREASWVVRDVWPPFQKEGGIFIWNDTLPNGDINRDGYPEVTMIGRISILPPGKSQERAEFVFGGPLQRKGFWPPKLIGLFPFILLRWNGRLMGARNGVFDNAKMEIWDLAKKQRAAVIPFPAAPEPFLPKPDAFSDKYYPAGDVNHDGFDDLLTFSGVRDYSTDPPTDWVYTMLVDGATEKVIWNFFHQKENGFLSAFPRDGRNFDDLNGDGFGDPVVSIEVKFGVTTLFAISGKDGSVIWEKTRPATSKRPLVLDSFQTISDLNGDGVADLLTFQKTNDFDDPGEIRALDGTDGSTLWTQHYGELLPFFGTDKDHKVASHRAMGELGDWDRDGVADLMLVTLLGKNLDTRPKITYAALVFSGSDGAFLANEAFPRNLDPWYPQILVSQAFSVNGSILGDVDGDGWTEVGFRIGGYPDFETTSTVFAIFGRPTLFGPGKVRPGEVFSLRIDVPKGANLPFKLLLSTGFDREGGFLAGGRWKTHLVKDALFAAAFGRSGFQGVLDAKGQAEIPIQIPPGLHLSGKTIHAVAVVRNPAHPDGIQTVSSLARFRVR